MNTVYIPGRLCGPAYRDAMNKRGTAHDRRRRLVSSRSPVPRAALIFWAVEKLRGKKSVPIRASVGWPRWTEDMDSWSCSIRTLGSEYKSYGIDPEQALALAEWFVNDHMAYRGFRVVERHRLIRFRPSRIKPYTPPPRPTAQA